MKLFLRVLLLVAALVAAGTVGWYLANRQPDTGGEPVASATPLADDCVVLYAPLPEQRGITSPLKVTGKARCGWYFEASFPVMLTDWDGRIIAEAPAQAKSDWMTEEFVEFEATLTFDIPAGPGKDQPNRGFLILKKDNPSGLPEYDDHREIMVFFSK